MLIGTAAALALSLAAYGRDTSKPSGGGNAAGGTAPKESGQQAAA